MDAATWPAGPGGAGSEAPAERSGSTVGGWKIERALGAGPVCDSYLASRGTESAVLRVLRDPWARDEKARNEWARASWAANRFQHARVTKILEQLTDDRGAPVIVRAWAKGESLEETARRGGMELAAALRITEQLLDALEMAHAHGILHGGLSPTNVVVTPRGTARLLDFATTPGVLARHSGASEPLARARSGPFLAPERRSSPPGPATEVSDVWGVGVCLHYALTGEAPPDDPRAVQLAGVREDVAALVLLATARDPAARYESAYAMLGDVRRVLAGKKPLLDAATGPVPSQRAVALPPSSSGLRGLDPPALPSIPPTAGQWRGNVLLIVAIAVLVGLATFVLVRERLGDQPRFQPSTQAR